MLPFIFGTIVVGITCKTFWFQEFVYWFSFTNCSEGQNFMLNHAQPVRAQNTGKRSQLNSSWRDMMSIINRASESIVEHTQLMFTTYTRTFPVFGFIFGCKDREIPKPSAQIDSVFSKTRQDIYLTAHVKAF